MTNEILEIPCTVSDDHACVISFDPIFDDNELPHISVVTITRDRPLFYPLMLRNIQLADYPKNRMQWIIIEDGHSRFDRSQYYKADDDTVLYKYIGEGGLVFPIGYKRNLAVSLSRHDIIVHVDDDDYYPPESFLARVRSLESFRCDCVGCVSVQTFHLLSERMTVATETSVVNMSESSLAYRRSFWEEKRFVNACSCAEGVAFIAERYDRCRSIPSQFVITQFDHLKNTVKRNVESHSYIDYGHGAFLKNTDAATRSFVLSLRDRIVYECDETTCVRQFIRRCGSMKQASKRMDRELPAHLRRHPLVCHLRHQRFDRPVVKNKYDVVFYCASGTYMTFNRVWDSHRNTNIGGSEESIINLSRSLVKLGRRVHVFNEREDCRYLEGVTYAPWYCYRPALHHANAVVVWRDPSNLTIPFQTEALLFDVHDYLPTQWFSDIDVNDKRLVAIMLKSAFHANVVPERLRTLVRIVPNGIPVTPNSTPLGGRRDVILSTSSPERCWIDLFRLARDIEPDYPEFMFEHAYDTAAIRNSSMHWKILSGLYENAHTYRNVRLIGNVSIENVDELYRTSSVFIYPTRFPEIDCVSLSKAIMYGCRCIHTSAGAMKEKTASTSTCIPVSTSHGSSSFCLDETEYQSFKKRLCETLIAIRRGDVQPQHSSDRSYEIDGVAKEWNATLRNDPTN